MSNKLTIAGLILVSAINVLAGPPSATRAGWFAAANVPLSGSDEPDYWELAVTTTLSPQNFTLNIFAGTGISLDVDYGDGTVVNYDSTGNKTHSYAFQGSYTVKISGGATSGLNIRLPGAGGQVRGTGIIGGITGIESFRSTFTGCTGLTELPADLFRYYPQVSTDAFAVTFNGCTGLTELPAGLFRYNVNVGLRGFRATFLTCSNLASLPADLFRYNINVGDDGYDQTFRDCPKVVMRDDLWGPDLQAHFNGRLVSFYRFFYILPSARTPAGGTAPELWGLTNVTFGSTSGAFYGHDSTSLTNWESIPSAWGGP